MPLAPVTILGTLKPNPDGTLRTTNPFGDFNPTPTTLAVNQAAFTAAVGSLNSLIVGATAINFNLRGSWLTGTQASSCTFVIATISGNDAAAKNWGISGANLTQSLVAGSVGSGVFSVSAVDASNNQLLMGQFVWSVLASGGGSDTLAPTVPTALVGAATTGINNSVTVTFDASTDLTMSTGVAPSGVDHYNVRNGANTVVATVPAVASKLPAWTLTNLGNISSPGAPTVVQSGKQYTVTAAGTGIHNTATEQCVFYSQQVSGAFQITAKVNSYTSANAFSTFGLMVHATAVQGGIFAAAYLQPSGGAHGLQLKVRQTAGGNGGNQVTIATDGAGNPILGPVYIRIQRASDLQTLTVTYSLDGKTFTAFGTLTLPMPQTVFVGLVGASQTAGTNAACVIEEISVTSAPALSATFTASSIDSYTVEAVDFATNVSAHLTGVTVTPTQPSSPPPGSAVILYPGFYPNNANFHLDQVGDLKSLNKYAAYANLRGMQKQMYYAGWDNGSGGPSYTAGQNYMAAMLLRANQIGKKIMWGFYDHNTFPGGASATVKAVNGVTPPWWVNNGTGWAVGTKPDVNNFAQAVIINLSSSTIVEGALKPLLKSYLDLFAADPAFAGLSLPVLETVVGNAPGYNRVQYYNNVKSLYSWIRTNYPTLVINFALNYYIGGTDTDVQALYSFFQSIGGVAVFSTDPVLPAPGYQFAGGEANHRGIQANNVYCGYSFNSPPGNQIYTDWRGKMMSWGGNQYIGAGDKSLTNITPSNLPDIFAQNRSLFGPCWFFQTCYDQNSSGPAINRWDGLTKTTGGNAPGPGLGTWFQSSEAANYFAGAVVPVDNFSYVVR